MSNETQNANIKVSIRIRPKIETEYSQNSNLITTIGNSIIISLKNSKEIKQFSFDYIANEDTTQSEIFINCGKEICDKVLNGINGSILVYGQTSAGKTYTLLGNYFSNYNNSNLNFDNIISENNNLNYQKNFITYSQKNKEESKGIIPRVLEYIFEQIKNDYYKKYNFNIKCSFIEIYNEQLIDLLNPNDKKNLNIRENNKNELIIENLIKIEINNINEGFNIIKTGIKNRHIGITNMNKNSSRSHAIFTLYINSKKNENGKIIIQNSIFNLVDLAGSERQKLTKCDGIRLKEAGLINKSLMNLSHVIQNLSLISNLNNKNNNNNKNIHIHYRDSKLTFLLKDSLGGNSYTCFIANISPSNDNITETLSTLFFAQSAKKVKNKPLINLNSFSNCDNKINKDEYFKEKEKYENLKNEIYYLLTLISNIDNNLNDNLIQDSIKQQNNISKIIDYVEEEATKISNEIDLKDKEIINLSNINKKLYLTLEKIENEIKIKDKELNILKEIFKETKIEFNLMKNSLKPIALRNAYQTEDLSKIKSKKINMINSQIENLEKLNKDINEKKDLIILKKNVIESSKEEINLNKIELENKNNEISNLEKNINEYNCQISELNKKVNEQKEKIKMLNNQIEEKKKEIDKNNQILTIKRNNYEEIKRDIKNISKELNSKIYFINLEKMDKLEKLSHLKKQLSFQKEEIERLESIKINFESQIDNLNNETIRNLQIQIEETTKSNEEIEKENKNLINEFNDLNKKFEFLSENNFSNEIQKNSKQISLLTKTSQENIKLKQELKELKEQFNNISLPLKPNKSNNNKLDILEIKNEKENILNLNKLYLQKTISRIKEELNVSNEEFSNGAKSDLIDEFLFYFDKLKNVKMENKSKKEMYIKENQNLDLKIASLKRDLNNIKNENNNLNDDNKFKRLTFGDYLNNKNICFEFGKKRKSYQINNNNIDDNIFKDNNE